MTNLSPSEEVESVINLIPKFIKEIDSVDNYMKHSVLKLQNYFDQLSQEQLIALLEILVHSNSTRVFKSGFFSPKVRHRKWHVARILDKLTSENLKKFQFSKCDNIQQYVWPSLINYPHDIEWYNFVLNDNNGYFFTLLDGRNILTIFHRNQLREHGIENLNHYSTTLIIRIAKLVTQIDNSKKLLQEEDLPLSFDEIIQLVIYNYHRLTPWEKLEIIISWFAPRYLSYEFSKHISKYVEYSSNGLKLQKMVYEICKELIQIENDPVYLQRMSRNRKDNKLRAFKRVFYQNTKEHKGQQKNIGRVLKKKQMEKLMSLTRLVVRNSD